MRLQQLILLLLALVVLPNVLKAGSKVGDAVGDIVGDAAEGASDTFSHQMNESEIKEKKRIEKIQPLDGGGKMRLSWRKCKERANRIYEALNQSGTDEDTIYKMLSYSQKWVSNGYSRKNDVKFLTYMGQMATNSALAMYSISQLNKISAYQEYWDSKDTLTNNELRMIFKAFGMRQNKGYVGSDWYNLVDFVRADDEGELYEFVRKLFHQNAAVI